MNVEGTPVEDVMLHRVGVRHDGGEAPDELDGLAHHVFHGGVVGVVVVGVEHQNAALQLIHDVLGGCFQDHILKKAVGQGAGRGQNGVEVLKLVLGGELAEQQEIGHLFIAEGAQTAVHVQDLVDVDAPVIEPARNGNLLIVPEVVALYAAHPGDAGHDAGAVRVPQAPLHRVRGIVTGVDAVFVFHFRTEGSDIIVDPVLVQIHAGHILPNDFLDHSITNPKENCKLKSKKMRFSREAPERFPYFCGVFEILTHVFIFRLAESVSFCYTASENASGKSRFPRRRKRGKGRIRGNCGTRRKRVKRLQIDGKLTRTGRSGQEKENEKDTVDSI